MYFLQLTQLLLQAMKKSVKKLLDINNSAQQMQELEKLLPNLQQDNVQNNDSIKNQFHSEVMMDNHLF